MNKTALTDRVARELGIPRRDADRAVTAVLDSILAGLFTDGKVVFSSLGTFVLTDLRPRNARNPATGETFIAPARKAMRFRPAGGLNAALKAGEVVTSSRRRPRA